MLIEVKCMRLNVYSDGGARGNPGPAAAAYVVLDENERAMLRSGSRYLGVRTNNQAEYEALIDALKTAIALHAEEVVCHLDSELVCKHLTGEYRVKHPALRLLWVRVQDLNRGFREVRFVHVPRSNRFIQEADRLVNERLDETQKRRL
ncbi:MAG: ribonuclease HI family protein [Candidatus Bathyarchaeota archaeon]|nr:ribonuclease HI family protein [Candidatus Bathyarchaeota archaeon]